MKYMQKKGEDFPVPFDSVIYDASIYEVFEVLEGEAVEDKPKARKAKAPKAVSVEPEEAGAPVFDLDDFADLD